MADIVTASQLATHDDLLDWRYVLTRIRATFRFGSFAAAGTFVTDVAAASTQRNRFHIDVSVPHDVAEERIAAALAAGGHLVTDEFAKSWWVLADVEGNEACVCTWQGRD